MLTASECERVATAIRDAEANTAGEIVVVIARAAASYRSVPLVYALLGALATPWPVIWLTDLSATRIFLVQAIVALILAIVLSWPDYRLSLVPEFIKRARGREAAAREFRARGLTRTRDHTGVLLYVAVAERYAEVIADTAISQRVDDTVWRETITGVVEAIRQGRAADGLVAAVQRLGAILREHVPSSLHADDELPNRIYLV
jgi:putative membrane protein